MGMVKPVLIARAAEEGHEAETPHVEGGHERDDQSQRHKHRMVQGGCDDFVLGEETGKRRNAGNGHGRNHERYGGDLHFRKEPAHLAYVVGMHGVNDRTGAQEQQAFEKGVCKEVEGPGIVSRRMVAQHRLINKKGDYPMMIVDTHSHAGINWFEPVEMILHQKCPV